MKKPAKTVDLDAIAPKAREKLIAQGLIFGSRDVLAQARVTLKAYEKRGAALAGHGFNQVDAARLSALEGMLSEAQSGREEEAGRKQAASETRAAAMEKGSAARHRVRGVLEGLRDDFEESGDTEAERVISVVLGQTRVAAKDPEGLAVQLDQLVGAIKHERVLPVAKQRGEAKVADESVAIAGTLRQAARDAASVRGTLTETQYMDLLDGLIVRLVRRAHRAARNAGRALGDPALGREFRLTKLYPGRAAAALDDEDGDDLDEAGADGGQGPVVSSD